MVSFLGTDNGCVCDQREVDSRVGHEIGLKLGQVNVQSTVKAKRSRDRRNYLSNQTVKVGVGIGRSISILRQQMS